MRVVFQLKRDYPDSSYVFISERNAPLTPRTVHHIVARAGEEAEFEFTRDVITFQGKSVKELRQALKGSVDAYLKFCEKKGKEPDKPFSGKFIMRVTPEQHRKIFIATKKTGRSLNGWVAHVLEDIADHTGVNY